MLHEVHQAVRRAFTKAGAQQRPELGMCRTHHTGWRSSRVDPGNQMGDTRTKVEVTCCVIELE